jgi:hypothetical protein
MIATADQGRAAAGEAAFTTASFLTQMYHASTADSHDVTSGTTAGSPRETAGTGYDLATGVGSPAANHLIADLISPSVPTTPPVSPPTNPPVSPPPTSPPVSPPPSSGPVTTSTRLTAGPVVYHWGYATVNLTITVSPSSGSALPGGLVDIYANGQRLGTVTLRVVNGVETASVTLIVYQSGTYNVSAGYVGNSSFGTSSSNGLSIIV